MKSRTIEEFKTKVLALGIVQNWKANYGKEEEEKVEVKDLEVYTIKVKDVIIYRNSSLVP